MISSAEALQCDLSSIISLHLLHLNFPWIKFPSIESNKDPNSPAIVKGINISSIPKEKWAIKPIINPPHIELNVPKIVMPPDVPLETFFFEKISVGDAFEKYPISVPHVSAVAEEIAPKKNMDE